MNITTCKRKPDIDFADFAEKPRPAGNNLLALNAAVSHLKYLTTIHNPNRLPAFLRKQAI